MTAAAPAFRIELQVIGAGSVTSIDLNAGPIWIQRPFVERVDALEAVERGSRPLRQFMLKYAREKDLALFLELAKEPRPSKPDDVAMRVVVPAYMLSELRVGFQIGAALYLPFLVIDMVVAAITTSIGMLQLPPVVISTPLKLLLFVMVDGWNLLVGSLMKSFT